MSHAPETGQNPSGGPKPSSGRRYLALDIVRGVAAFSVLESHWTGWTSPRTRSAGWFDQFVGLYEWLEHRLFSSTGVHPGVVVFIVLSGFCIHLPLASATAEKLKAHAWSRYAVRRVTRIAPLYWFGCALGLWALFVERATLAHGPGISGDSLVFSPLALCIKAAFLEPLFFSQPTYLNNGPLATVATEMWLYALYPFGLWARRRWGFGPVFALGVLLQLLGLGLVRHGAPPERIAASLYVFFLWWWMGVWAVERFVAGLRTPSASVGWRWAVATGVAYVVCHHAVHVRGSHYLASSLLAAFTAASLMASLQAEVGRGRPLAGALRAMAWFGERSYSLYAVHAPVLVLAIVAIERWLPDRPLALRALPLAIVAATAAWSFRWVELPSVRLGAWLSSRVGAREPAAALKLTDQGLGG